MCRLAIVSRLVGIPHDFARFWRASRQNCERLREVEKKRVTSGAKYEFNGRGRRYLHIEYSD